MTKPTKAELYAEVSKLKSQLALETDLAETGWQEADRIALEYAALKATNNEQHQTLVATIAAREQYRNRSIESGETIEDLEKVIRMEREAAVADFNRYGDHLAKLRRQLNRANWYVAAMFVATVSMAAMAAVAIFV